MHPINPPARTAIQRSLDEIAHHFTIARVTVHESRYVSRGGVGDFMAKPGTYDVSHDSATPRRIMVTASPITANHLHALGVADLHMRNGETKKAIPIVERCRESNRAAYRASRMEDAE